MDGRNPALHSLGCAGSWSKRSAPAMLVVALALALFGGSGRAVAAGDGPAGMGAIDRLVAGVMNGLPPPPSAAPLPAPSAPAGPKQTGWRARRPVLSTPWTAHVSPTNENWGYPRPQMTRTALGEPQRGVAVRPSPGGGATAGRRSAAPADPGAIPDGVGAVGCRHPLRAFLVPTDVHDPVLVVGTTGAA